MEDIVEVVRHALCHLSSDGRVEGQIRSQPFKKVLKDQRRAGSRRDFDILEALPAFGDLDERARQGVIDAVCADDRWSMVARRWKPRQRIARLFRGLSRGLPETFSFGKRVVEGLEMALIHWMGRFTHEAYRTVMRVWALSSARPPLAAVLLASGIEPRMLASEYAEALPQPRDTAGYLLKERDGLVVGVTVGIDFILNRDGVWFVESNLNPGLMEERSRLYSDEDPFVRRLIDFTKTRGFENLQFLACNDVPVDDIMADRIIACAAAEGITAEVLEDSYAPTRRWGQAFLVPDAAPRNTLVVRSKMFHTSMDALFHHKLVSQRTLKRYIIETNEESFRIPRDDLTGVRPADTVSNRFPNVVCKFTERDQGQGVVFLRVSGDAQLQEMMHGRLGMDRVSVSDVWTRLRYRLGMEDQQPIVQDYIASDLIDDRFLYIVRAHVLATPKGLQFLSAHRVVSTVEVPASINEGLVTDASPYIVNYSLGSYHAPVPRDEEIQVERASLAVCTALCQNVERRFITS